MNDIPGNRPEDEEWDEFFETVTCDTGEMELTPRQAAIVWHIGLQAWLGVANSLGEDDGRKEKEE